MLNLSKEDQAEYERKCAINQARKEQCTASGDAAGAKKARQANTYLYQEYEAKQLPPPPPDKWDIEQSISIEDRLLRIEQALKLGQFSDSF